MKYNRHSIRLNNFDYSKNGYYFVTICAHYRNNVFGEIVGARRDAPIINKNNDDNLSKIKLNNNLFEIKLNQNGKIINEIWKTLPDHHDVILDEFIIMPDHIHFILVIKNNKLNINDKSLNNDGSKIDGNGLKNNNGVLENNTKGASRRAPTSKSTLGFVIGMFKTECTKRINKLNETPGIQIFQRNYYEHIIKNEKEYLRIKKYIKDNPDNLNL